MNVVIVRPTRAGYEYVTRGGPRSCPTIDQAVIKAVRYARRIGASIRVFP